MMGETTKEEMLERIRKRGVTDNRILTLMGEVDRKNFVSDEWRQHTYDDGPLPLGYGQTISQPYTVARMIELLIHDSESMTRESKILEVGTGSGWQTAILARLFKEVYSVEIIPELAETAGSRIQNSGLNNIKIKIGNGKFGWREYAPFDGIICGADADDIPRTWKDQLNDNGRIVCPVKGVMKRITKIIRGKDIRYQEEEFGGYSFVPLV